MIEKHNESLPPVSEEEKRKNRLLPAVVPGVICTQCDDFKASEGTFSERVWAVNLHGLKEHDLVPLSFGEAITVRNWRRLVAFNEALIAEAHVRS